MQHSKLLSTCATFCLLVSLSGAQQTTSLNSSAIESKINELLRKMTLEEKVGQLVQFSAGSPTGPGTGRADYPTMISQGQVGSLFNLKGPKETNAMQHLAMEKSRLHIPLLFGLDVIHGYRTEFPVPLGMSATWNPALVERAARVAAQEAAMDGLRWTFSPMVDIARDARWGRITEGAGEDPYLGSAMAQAYVRGYQGTLGAPDSIAACAKHYVGYGAAEGGRDYNTTDISEHTLRQVYLPPFKAAADAGTLSFMSAFNALNGVPASANAFTLRQVLRKEWNYKGLVVSDWQSVGELISHGIANDPPAAARRAFLGGVDMDMESGFYHQHLLQLVKSGAVSESLLNESVKNVLRVKFALGLFEHPYTDETKNVYAGPIPAPSRELARQVAEESFVMLKNGLADKPVLPLDKSQVKTIALIGPLADDAQNMLGSWGGGSRPEDAVTLRKALFDLTTSANIKLSYAKGGEITSTTDAALTEAIEAARSADVVLLAVGEDAGGMTGEAASRTRLGLPGDQAKLLDKVAQTGKPVVLIVFSGRPLVLTDVAPKASAILEAWFPGVEAGPALVRILFGEANPSGRLTATFPRNVGQEPLYYNALNTGRPAGDVNLSHPPTNGEEKFKSRYIDEMNAPLFPFGFGLSYSSFSYSQPRLSTATLSANTLNTSSNGGLRVTAEVQNTSTRAGQAVAQLYISETGTSVALPVRELKGFQKFTLAPGQSKTVEFTIGAQELAFWNVDMKHVVEPARVRVWIAPDSASGSPVEFEIRP